MPEFLVELYAARDDEVGDLVKRVRNATQQLEHEGVDVHFLRTIFVPEDETCFFLLAASTVENVGVAVELAGLPFDRVTAAVSADAAAQE